jgi:hypothetical protein
MQNPRKEIERIDDFLDGILNVEEAIKAVDPRLWRNVRI